MSPTDESGRGRSTLGPRLVVVVAVGISVSGCSSGAVTTTTSTTTTTTTTTVLAPARPAVFRAGRVAVRISFPGSPTEQADPPSLVGIFPSGTSVTAWSVGNVGALELNSFELAIALLPASASGAEIDALMAKYFGQPNTALYGQPALHEISAIPVSGTTHYSGITAFRIGGVAVIAVGYGANRGVAAAFLASLQLISPEP
ncbi:MAG: hypothetical protein ABSD78_14345 [Acidimicrobiales bacterium]